jgi:HK97 family phage portal protein
VPDSITIFSALSAPIRKAAPTNLSGVENRGGWWPIIREPYSGAWQNNDPQDVDTVLAHSAVFACVTLISSDIAKMRLKLVEERAGIPGIWEEVESAAFSPLIRKPNRYQNRIQFFYWWSASKLLHGNTYALKQHDGRGVVHGLYLLDPTRVRPLVAPDGAVYYELKTDSLSNLQQELIVPASEIIHDVGHPLFHPLVGVSPIYACGVAALAGIRIQNNSSQFFANGSKPGGVLTAPGPISQETASRVKTYWDNNFTGDNMGKVAVLGDGLKYEAMAVTAKDAELVEQLKWTGMDVCTAFRVPAYKVGIGPAPSYNNLEALDAQYYSQRLQFDVESIELLLDEGLGLAPNKIDGRRLGVEFDLDDLLRMDQATLVRTEKESTGIKSVNESRRRLGLPPVDGGSEIYMQQQYWPLSQVAMRANMPQLPPAPVVTSEPMMEEDDTDKAILMLEQKAVELCV